MQEEYCSSLISLHSLYDEFVSLLELAHTTFRIFLYLHQIHQEKQVAPLSIDLAFVSIHHAFPDPFALLLLKAA